MLQFIVILLSLILLFRLGGLFMGLGMVGGLWMGGGYHPRVHWEHRSPMAHHGGVHHDSRSRF